MNRIQRVVRNQSSKEERCKLTPKNVLFQFMLRLYRCHFVSLSLSRLSTGKMRGFSVLLNIRALNTILGQSRRPPPSIPFHSHFFIILHIYAARAPGC
jgi:hypothetical protein